MSDRPSVSINLITRDCPEDLERCLASVYEHLFEDCDETIVVDTGSSPENLQKNREVIGKFANAQLIHKPELLYDFSKEQERWIPETREHFDGKTLLSFADARQVALDASTKDVLFWIDCDDVFVNEAGPDAVRDLLTRVFNNDSLGGIFLDYNYAHAPDGTCTTVLKRERFVRRDEYYWKGSCHETLIIKPEAPQRHTGYWEGLPIYIRHTRPPRESRGPAADARNYCILRNELETAPGDPRTEFYFANAARGCRRFWEAIPVYQRFLDRSGSEDDRWAASYYLAGMYLDPTVGRPVDARDWYYRCLDIRPTDPRAVFGLARVALYMRRFKEVLIYYKQGLCMPPVRTTHSFDPTHVAYHPHLVAAQAAKELGDSETALEYVKRAIDARPRDELTQNIAQAVYNESLGDKITESVLNILNCLEFRGPNARRIGRAICNELRAVPTQLEKRGLGRTEPPDPRTPAPNLSIFCGPSREDWDFTSRQGGIGGSEKMVIILAAALARKGVNVSVYCEVVPEHRGIDAETGVIWRHWSEFDEERPRDVLVLWRNPGAVTALQSPAKKRVLWNHDVQNPATYTEELLACVDFVQVQSKFHAEPLRDVVPADKLWISRNAVEPPAYDITKERAERHVVFFSAPERGLVTACRVIKRYNEMYPEPCHLIAMYGVSPWARSVYAQNRHRSIFDMGGDWDMDDYERLMHKEMDEIGGIFLGRIGFDDVSKALAAADAWLYPTRFPEISCMAAMETQAHGVTPVCTNYGALKETVRYGAILEDLPESGPPSDEWYTHAAQELHKALDEDSENRVKMAKNMQRRFSVDTLADEWIKKLGLESSNGGGKGGRGNAGVAAGPELSTKDIVKEAVREAAKN